MIAAIDKPVSAYVTPALPSWLSLSGELRFRFEGRQGNGFRKGNDDGYGLFRTRVNIGVKAKPWLEFFFQGQDSRAPGHKNANGVFRDPFDVRQAYVKIGGGGESAVTVTAGRQLLLYGDQRLIGPLDWTNTSRTWDAVKLELRPSKDAKFDVFASSVVQNDPTGRINHHQDGANLHGVYGSIKKVIPKSTIEPFAMWQTNPLVVNELNFRGDLDRYTSGVRVWGKGLGAWDYNVAIVNQWGNVAGAKIGAWGSYAEVGYSIAAPWKPRAYAEYTFGSGDSNPNDNKIGGFNDLYPTAHLWYGYNDLVGWRNLKNVRLGLDLKPYRNLGVKLDYHSFWLANRNDGLYNVAGVRTVAAPAGGAASTKIGDEVDATFTIPVSKTITIGGGVGHMFTGAFLKQNTPGSGNTFTFLFTSFKL
ncbi:MAG: alginate export family protein [Bryobacterales bacterium]|nr:alginate export family protein [Bryobacterales bacterium]